MGGVGPVVNCGAGLWNEGRGSGKGPGARNQGGAGQVDPVGHSFGLETTRYRQTGLYSGVGPEQVQGSFRATSMFSSVQSLSRV